MKLPYINSKKRDYGPTIALWLSIDGDDTASDFELEIIQIVLNN